MRVPSGDTEAGAALGAGDVMGRPRELDDLKAKRIVDAIAAGNTRACAAGLGGVTESSLYKWLARGRKGDASYLQFFQRVKEAEARAEANMVLCVTAAASSGAPGTWKAALEWLQARRPKGWKRQQPEAKDVDLSEIDEQELWAAADKLRHKESA